MEKPLREKSKSAPVLFHLKVFQTKDFKYFVLLGAVVLGIIILNQLWLTNNTRPPHWDMATHLSNSLVYFSRFNLHQIIEFIFTYRFYPPLVYWVALPFYFLFGNSISNAALSNIVFLTILTFSTYFLGKNLWNRRVGFLAAIFVLGSPMIVSQFKEFQIDAPLASMVALGLVFLIKTKEFSDEKWSFGFGVVLGLGMLTKWSFGFFLVLPILVSIFLLIKSSLVEKSFVRVKNLIISLLIAYFVCGFWYLSNLRSLQFDISQSVAAGIKEGDPLVGSFSSNIYYLLNLLNNQLYLALLLFLVVGIGFLFFKRVNLRKNIYPIALIIGSFVIFSLLRNKDARYTLPILSSVALLSTYWLEKINVRLSLILASFLVLYSLIAFFAVSFGLPFIPKNIVVNNSYVLFAQHGYLIGPPVKEDWYQEKVTSLIKDSSVNKKKLCF